ncbi:type IV secretion system DNA-binding domain-containing protein [Enterobacter cloacae]|uniref:type IV secretion system DNA-binding domain-containing protein n=1 Tax=Enterobacter cloacae TaxID=550 RepID=UPI00388D0FBC
MMQGRPDGLFSMKCEVMLIFDTYAYSLIPLGKSSTEEEWNAYGRLLVSEVGRKLHEEGQATLDKLFYWCCAADEEAVEEYCKGTLAESLFIGTDRTIDRLVRIV